MLSTTAATTVKFFAFAYGGNDSAADGHFSSTGNPGFEGFTGTGAVPEPAMWLMMIVGFGAVGGMSRFETRRRQARVA